MPGRQRDSNGLTPSEDDIDRAQTAGGRRQTGREQADSLNRFYERLTGEEPPPEE